MDESVRIARFMAYRKLMEKLPEAAGSRKKPENCEVCEYYQPDWKYRKCYLIQCAYGKTGDVFHMGVNGRRTCYGEA